VVGLTFRKLRLFTNGSVNALRRFSNPFSSIRHDRSGCYRRRLSGWRCSKTNRSKMKHVSLMRSTVYKNTNFNGFDESI
jgi:hypothetical protein